MKLTLEQIRSIARGVAHVEEQDGVYRLFRFTEAQTQAYLERGNMDHYQKTYATAGVRLAFRTDSQRLTFSYRLEKGSSRKFAWFDIYQNGQLTNHFGSEGEEYQEGRVSVSLLVGEKDVELYLPWPRATLLWDVELEDGSTLLPVHRAHRMIAYGDSITQGYDAVYPSLSYVSTLARMLDADVIDKGIGGDTFFPTLTTLPDEADPEYVTVAYGTNDWNRFTYEVLLENCRAFYQNLSALYPHAKIFAITPICRLDAERNTPFAAPAYALDRMIRKACEGLSNVTVLNGWCYVPSLKEFFSDGYLHPNDQGFSLYAQHLYRDIVSHL